MNAKSYNAMWKKVGPQIIAAAQAIRADILGVADGFTASEVLVDLGDESNGALIMLTREEGGGGNPDAVVSIKLVDDSPKSGVNIKISIDNVAEQTEEFAYIPHNFTTEVFTHDADEIIRRIQDIPQTTISTACVTFMAA